MSLRECAEDKTRADELHVTRRAERARLKGDRKVVRKQKSGRREITELWESLMHFSRNNLGRSLSEQDVSSNITAPSDGVHFVNIDDWDDDVALDNSKVFFDKKEPLVTIKGSVDFIRSTAFTIPELPQGKKLAINLLSTWGDPHYIGLMGLEFFDKAGHPVTLSNIDQQIWANPADINVLQEYGTVASDTAHV